MPKSNSEMWGRIFDHVNAGTPQHDELAWQYCGLDIWPIVKAQILTRASNIFNASRDMSLAARKPASPKRSLLSRLHENHAKRTEPTPKIMPTFDWPALPRPGDDTDVICLGYATNHKKLGDNYFQLCMDPLRLAFDRAGATAFCLVTGLEDTADGISLAAAKDTHGIEQEFRAVRNFAKSMPPVELKSFRGFAPWWQALERLMGKDVFVSPQHIETIIQQTAVVGAWLRDYLAATRPKAVLVSAYYGLMGHGGSWACRELGIPIADIQHGVAGSHHHAYSWPNAPLRGFNTLPTAFLTWSEHECAEMQRTSGEWQPSLASIGNVWRLLDEMLHVTEDNNVFRPGALAVAREQLRADRATIGTLKANVAGTKDILIALHPDEDISWFRRLRQLSPAEWRFWIRLHPGELRNEKTLKKRLGELSGERTFISEPSSAPLNVVLEGVDIVLTKFSSLILDARAYGVPTVAYSDAARFFYQNVETPRISFVAPYAERMHAALVQRLSDYATPGGNRQAVDAFEQMGASILELLTKGHPATATG